MFKERCLKKDLGLLYELLPLRRMRRNRKPISNLPSGAGRGWRIVLNVYRVLYCRAMLRRARLWDCMSSVRL